MRSDYILKKMINLQWWFFPSIYDRFGGFVIVTLINLPHFKGFRFCRLYSSSVAFIRGQCNFLPSTTYYRHRNRTLMATIERSLSKELQWVFMKNAWVPTAHGCSLELRLWEYDSDKQWSHMSALLQRRGISEWMFACLYVYYRLSGAGHSPLGADCPLHPNFKRIFSPIFFHNQQLP